MRYLYTRKLPKNMQIYTHMYKVAKRKFIRKTLKTLEICLIEYTVSSSEQMLNVPNFTEESKEKDLEKLLFLTYPAIYIKVVCFR